MFFWRNENPAQDKKRRWERLAATKLSLQINSNLLNAFQILSDPFKIFRESEWHAAA
jgi:hypothetical protein